LLNVDAGQDNNYKSNVYQLADPHFTDDATLVILVASLAPMTVRGRYCNNRIVSVSALAQCPKAGVAL